MQGRMKIPKRYMGKTLGLFLGFDNEKEIAKEAILNNKSVFLSGGCGTGKTHLAIALLLEWFNKYRPDSNNQYGFPVFIPSVEFFLELKNTFGNDESEKYILDRYTKPELLCIDDVGAEKISDWSRQMFYTLVDRRYREEKQTIITSNLSLADISKLIDDRIASRIAGQGAVINLVAEDFRLK